MIRSARLLPLELGNLILGIAASVMLAACGGGGDGIQPEPPVSVAISPRTVTMGAGETRSFGATVMGSSNTSVTWNASGGEVSGTGNSITCTAPTSTGSYTVRATSIADPSKSATANVTVTAVSVSVAPDIATVLTNQEVAITATVTGTTAGGVIWTATCGVVDGTGTTITFTAPAAPGECIVTATSTVDSSASDTAVITVNEVEVTIGPEGATLFTGEQLQFTADVTGSTETEVARAATCGASGLGGGGYFAFSEVTANLGFFFANEADTGGGVASHFTTFVATESSFSDNMATSQGGSRVFEMGVVGMNTTAFGLGAGLYFQSSATLEMRDARLTGNQSGAAGGGAQFALGASGTFDRVTIDGNGSVSLGGGLSVSGGSTVFVVNSTISGNSGSFGGGIYATEGTVVVNGASIVGNSAGPGNAGGGIFPFSGSISVRNTLLAGNLVGVTPGNCGVGPGGAPLITSLDHNLSDDGTCVPSDAIPPTSDWWLARASATSGRSSSSLWRY